MRQFFPATISILFLLFAFAANAQQAQSQTCADWLSTAGLYKDMSWVAGANFKINGKPATYADAQHINFDSVLKVEVYRKKEAITTFGKEEGSKGVVLITKRKRQELKPDIILLPDSTKFFVVAGDSIFIKAPTDASFVGGMQAWSDFLSKNLNASIPVDNGAPAGVYKAYIQFVVNKDGTTNNILIFEDAGYGTGKEVMRIIKNVPQWQPALYNDNPVKSIFVQPVIFICSMG